MLAGLLLVLCIGVTCFAQQKDAHGFFTVFNGKNLDGWQGDPVYWRVENNCLVGEVTPSTILKRNSFIIWQGEMPADFELKVEYRVSAKGNSGINYRSVPVEGTPFALRGYQADIDGQDHWSGQNYEERGREFLALRGQHVTILSEKQKIIRSDAGKDSLQQFVRKEEWNEYHLVVKGNHMRHYINGALMSDVIDEDAVNRRFNGLLGVQVHVGPPMKIEYRNFQVKAVE